MTTCLPRSLALCLAVALAAPAVSRAAPDKRERQALEWFAVGRYQDALDLFGKLYAEKLHPTYLRNIGRCYQNLGEPDKAIASFREYLRKAKKVPADERAEIEGHIKEMEDLKRQRNAAAEPPPPLRLPEPPPPAPIETPRVEPVAPSVPEPAVAQPAPPRGQPAAPLHRKTWFWVAVSGIVAAAAVGGLAAAGVFSSGRCPSMTACK